MTDALMSQTIEVMERRNIIGVLGDPAVAAWRRAAPRFLPTSILPNIPG